MGNLNRSERNRLEHMDSIRLQRELEQIEALKGAKARMMDETRRYIQELLAERSTVEKKSDFTFEQHRDDWTTALYNLTKTGEPERLEHFANRVFQKSFRWAKDPQKLKQADVRSEMPILSQSPQEFKMYDEFSTGMPVALYEPGGVSKLFQTTTTPPTVIWAPTLKRIQMNAAWEAVVLAQKYIEADYYQEEHFVQRGQKTGEWVAGVSHDTDSYVRRDQAIVLNDLFTEVDKVRLLQDVPAIAHFSTMQQLTDFLSADSSTWQRIERELDAAITLRPPMNLEEACARTNAYMNLILTRGLPERTRNLECSPRMATAVQRFKYDMADRRMARIPKRTTIDTAKVPKHLSHIDPAVFGTSGLIMATEAGKDIFLIRTNDFEAAGLTSSALAHGLTHDPLLTRERLAALLPEERHDEEAEKEWVSGELKSTREIEIEHIQQQWVVHLDRIKNGGYTVYDSERAAQTVFQDMLGKYGMVNAKVSGRDEPGIVIGLASPLRDRKQYDDFALGKVMDDSGSPIVVFKNPMTPQWAALGITDAIMIYSKDNFQEAVGLTAQMHMLGIRALSKNQYPIPATYGIRTPDEWARLPMENPEFFLRCEQAMNRGITRHFPLSEAEACIRIRDAVTLGSAGLFTGQNQAEAEAKMLAVRSNLLPLAKLKMSLRPQRIDQNDAKLAEVLDILDQTQLQPNADVAYGRIRDASYFICRKEHLPAAFAPYVSADNEETLDLVVNLNLQNEDALETDAWVSGRILSAQEIKVIQVKNRIMPFLIRAGTARDSDPDEERGIRNVLRSHVDSNLRWSPENISLAETQAAWPPIAITYTDLQDHHFYASRTGGQIGCTCTPSTPEWDAIEFTSMLGHAIFTPKGAGMGIRASANFKKLMINELSQGTYFDRVREMMTEAKFPDPFAVGADEGKTEDVLRSEVAANRCITRRWPQSRLEAKSRLISYLRAVIYVKAKYMGVPPQPSIQIQSWIDPYIDAKMQSIPTIIDRTHPALAETLEVIGDTAENFQHIRFVQVPGSSKFICRKEHLPAAFANYVSADNEETLDLVVNLNLQNEDALETDAWVSGALPTIEELEREFFSAGFVADRFFQADKKEPVASEDDEEKPVPSGAESVPKNDEPLPRMKTLYKVLLRNRWKAHFVFDELPSAPPKPRYDEAEPGHYELVSLPDAGMQFVISNDRSKGTFVLRNLIDPKQFEKLPFEEFLANYAATRIKYDSPEQFAAAITTEIREQIREPMTIYPVASSCRTPLDADRFPNEEAMRLLTRDFKLAATLAGKESIHDLTVGDFCKIESGPARWSFGGVAGGGTYLDRLATEFGLDASDMPLSTEEAPLKQYDFRERILSLVLCELSPEYFARKDKEQAGLSEYRRSRKRMRRAQRNGNGHATEAVEESAVQ